MTGARTPEAVMPHPRAREITRPIVAWYRRHGRADLPWRRPGTTPWQVLVAEVMLAQTPVSRVAPVYERWVERWPDAASTATASTSDLLRAWDRLGYPRRVLRLRECAVTVDRDFDGALPVDRAALRSLTGVGEYTSAAVLAFAFGRRVEVLDTNVRRVLARAVTGAAGADPALTNPERELAVSLLPRSHAAAATWSIAVMELGALVCTAARPACAQCPVRTHCAWRLAGYPPDARPRGRSQGWTGSDRQCRGRIMALLRQASAPVPGQIVRQAWPDIPQCERCLDALLDDGLIDLAGQDLYALPT